MPRQKLALAALVVAGVASLATTPAPPSIWNDARGALVLTPGKPTETLHTTLTLSATAYDPPPGDHSSLDISVEAPRDWIPGHPDKLPVQITFEGDAPTPLDTELKLSECVQQLSPRLAEVCRVARLVNPFDRCRKGAPCQMILDVRLDWIDPVQGANLPIEWSMSTRLEYAFKSSVPPGATVELHVEPR